MSNQLKMPNIQAILTLRQQGWTFSRIARELDLHRETVARYVRLHSKPAEAPTGSDDPKPSKAPPGSGDSKPAEVHSGSRLRVETRSECEPLREMIQQKLDLGLDAKRIHQDLVAEHQFDGSYWSVMRFVRRMRESCPLPFRRIECEPGEEAQVDFGTGAPVITAEGKRRKTYVFRIVLSHSRKGYSEAVYRQTTENFIRALENAFWHFRGTVKTLVIDNLRAAVQNADWYEPELHPRIRSFCEYYGVVILPTRPYMPRHKGKVEAGVKYVQNNALKARRFESLEAQNDFLLNWETTIADTRIHGTTQQQVAKLFEEVERSTLGPLQIERFPFFHEAKRRVHRDGHVEVDHSYYSTPPEYFRQSLWARWDSRLVRLFNEQMQEVCVHVKQHKPGTFSTHPAHIAAEKISGVERGTEWLLKRARCIGAHADQWAQQVIRTRRIEGVRTVMGLVSLAKRESCAAIDKACEIALSYGVFRLRSIRQLIKRQAAKQEQLEFMEEHPIIRSMDVYGELVKAALHQPPPSWQRETESLDFSPCDAPRTKGERA
jgi:transposase